MSQTSRLSRAINYQGLDPDLFFFFSQQMQKLHIDEFYRNTVPEGTPDCEPDPGFNYDKVTYMF